MPGVPYLVLPDKVLSVSRLFAQDCLYCDFVASGASEAAMIGAMDAHARYLNAHADREHDPHFEDQRMDLLLRA